MKRSREACCVWSGVVFGLYLLRLVFCFVEFGLLSIEGNRHRPVAAMSLSSDNVIDCVGRGYRLRLVCARMHRQCSRHQPPEGDRQSKHAFGHGNCRRSRGNRTPAEPAVTDSRGDQPPEGRQWTSGSPFRLCKVERGCSMVISNDPRVGKTPEGPKNLKVVTEVILGRDWGGVRR